MSEDEDLDLLALQRQLDDAFQTTRPRPAFEDELWLRIQARRPIWLRLRDGLSGLIEGMREAPAVPSAAVAIVLIVLVGAGIVTLSNLHPGGGASLATSSNQDGRGNAPTIAGVEQLPAPKLAQVAPSPIQTTVPTSAAPGSLYFGPATLSWAGNLDVTATNLPVFRYQEPTRADADGFAASLGAAPAGQPPPGALGTYSGANLVLVVTGTTAQPATEPTFKLTDASASPGTDPVAVATAYLVARNLLPSWPYKTAVEKTAGSVHVGFLRSFDLPQGQASLVNGAGDPYGIEVDLTARRSGAVEAGPLPLNLVPTSYPIISTDQAVRSAVASSAPAGAGIPVVRLTKAELVYTLVTAGDHSFYEPAFLFSGTFTDHGVTHLKRLLIPAVDPAFLLP
jgi:hypothetical protein